MKCHQAKENIFLYDQLSKDNKVSVDQHMAECDQCALLFQQFQERQELITEASSWREEPLDQEALTERIMSVIGQSSQNPIPWIDTVFNQFNMASVRYAMASLSLVLIAFFVLEFNQTGIQSRSQTIGNTTISENSVVLNSSLIKKELRGKRKHPKKLSLYKCLKECRFTANRKLCGDCKDRFKKIIGNYEDS